MCEMEFSAEESNTPKVRMLARRRFAKTPIQHFNASKDTIKDADALVPVTVKAMVASEHAADNVIFLSLATEWRMI